MSMKKEVLDTFGLGLSRLLRYSFGGFLLILLFSIVDPKNTRHIVDTITPTLAVLAAIIFGAGIYAAHRGLVILPHHLSLSFLFWIYENIRGVKKDKSYSPTRWLASKGVKCSHRILAYNFLRRSDIWNKEKKYEFNIAHAENGLVVMTWEFLLTAYLYSLYYSCDSKVSSDVLLILFIVFFIASYPMAFLQHSLECVDIRKKEKEVVSKLQESGFLNKKDSSGT